MKSSFQFVNSAIKCYIKYLNFNIFVLVFANDDLYKVNKKCFLILFNFCVAISSNPILYIAL